MKQSIILLVIITILNGLSFLIYEYINVSNNKLIEQNESISSENSRIKNKINKEFKNAKYLNEKLVNFYKNYFKKKFDLYVIDLWGLMEYIIPNNNFLQSIRFGKKTTSMKITFRSQEIPTLFILKKNLDELKKKGIIVNYKISDIKINKKLNKILSTNTRDVY